MQNPVKPAFTLVFYGGFLTRLSRPLDTPDIFSGVYRPSRTAHQALSSFELVTQFPEGGVPLAPPCSLARALLGLPPTLHSRNRITAPGCSKPPWGLLFPLGVRGIFTAQRVRRACARDSGDLVTPLVQAGIKPARYYATMRASELGPLFTRA